MKSESSIKELLKDMTFRNYVEQVIDFLNYFEIVAFETVQTIVQVNGMVEFHQEVIRTCFFPYLTYQSPRRAAIMIWLAACNADQMLNHFRKLLGVKETVH